MRLKPIAAGLAAAAGLAGLAAASPAIADEDPKPTIADVLLSDGDEFDFNPTDYDIVTQAVLAFPGLTAAAANAEASLTVFAPSDFAFRQLVYELTGKRYLREGQVFTALVGAVGLPTIEAVLKYHIIGAKIPSTVALQADGAQLDTLLPDPMMPGAQKKIGVDVLKPAPIIRLIDADTNDPDPLVWRYDVGGELANGFIHGITRVLRPVNLP